MEGELILVEVKCFLGYCEDEFGNSIPYDAVIFVEEKIHISDTQFQYEKCSEECAAQWIICYENCDSDNSDQRNQCHDKERECNKKCSSKYDY